MQGRSKSVTVALSFLDFISLLNGCTLLPLGLRIQGLSPKNPAIVKRK